MSDNNEMSVQELESSKLEMMRIRFRRVLGEEVSAHTIKLARKKVADTVRAVNGACVRGKDA